MNDSDAARAYAQETARPPPRESLINLGCSCTRTPRSLVKHQWSMLNPLRAFLNLSNCQCTI